MGLQIELTVGDDFYIDDQQYELIEIPNPTSCVVKKVSNGEQFSLTDNVIGVEIAEEVKAHVGLRGQNRLVRVKFDAPRSVLIDRGSTYRSAGGHPPRNTDRK